MGLGCNGSMMYGEGKVRVGVEVGMVGELRVRWWGGRRVSGG